jgi:hypothetical protein
MAQTVEYVECKAIGHNWERFQPIGMERPYFGWRLSLVCTTCETERHDIIDANGNVGSRTYYYPEDYKTAEKLTRDELRRMLAKKYKIRVRSE